MKPFPLHTGMYQEITKKIKTGMEVSNRATLQYKHLT